MGTHVAMKLTLLVLSLLAQLTSALQLTPKPIDRRAALRAGAAAVLPLFAGSNAAHALTAYVAKDFKDGVYVGPSVVGAAPTAEGEAEFDKLYAEAIAKKEKVVKEMGFDLDDADKLETEMLLRTQYCGFQAKLKCKGSPAANMLKK